jgi:hypothetical protein
MVGERVPVYLAAGLLQHYAAALGAVTGEIQGIIPKSDTLKLVREVNETSPKPNKGSNTMNDAAKGK